MLTRQEIVSMLPPLLLKVEEGHTVFDMCAAPGSKTAQLLEMVHQSGSAVPKGMVVANDSDQARAFMLTH